MSAWQPIETAPKDGTRVRLLCPEGEDTGSYDDYTEREWASIPGEWSTDFGNGEPTHWMPLPEPSK
jgi:hypothetical protein